MKRALVRPIKPNEFTQLGAMYAEFEPKERFQGLPPGRPTQITAWLRAHRSVHDHHFVAVLDRQIIGHAMLCCAVEQREAELAIFMHQDYRGRGIGKQLLLAILYYGCKKLQLDRVWVSVQGSNPCAIHVFESAGFLVRNEESLSWEFEMTRSSHCAACRGERCLLFDHATPLDVAVRAAKLRRQPRLTAR